MSIIKLAVYGGIGYLVYQTFFANMPASAGSGGGQGGSSGRQGGSQQGGGSADSASTMSGGGEGRIEQTAEPMGMSTRHRVGRGVI